MRVLLILSWFFCALPIWALEPEMLIEKIKTQGVEIQIDDASTSTMPNTRRFNPSGTLVFESDFSEANLPYFGRNTNAAYGSSSGAGIEFEAKPQEVSYEIKKKGRVLLSYQVRGERERFNVDISFFDNGRCTLMILGDYREMITYQGDFEFIVKEN